MKKQDVIKFFRTQTQVADSLLITRQAVSAWPDPIPEKQAARLHFMTQGVLEYRPEDYPR
jgi:hypothetical protein